MPQRSAQSSGYKDKTSPLGLNMIIVQGTLPQLGDFFHFIFAVFALHFHKHHQGPAFLTSFQQLLGIIQCIRVKLKLGLRPQVFRELVWLQRLFIFLEIN
jgi:hypothetical protein